MGADNGKKLAGMTIPNTYEVDEQKLHVPFDAICTVSHAEFEGIVHITIEPLEKCMEYCAVEQLVHKIVAHSFAEPHEVTHEQIARMVLDAVRDVTEPLCIEVEVEVTKSRAHQPASVRITEYREHDEDADNLSRVVEENVREATTALGSMPKIDIAPGLEGEG